ncbi:MAG: hypothetical protein ACO29Z_01695 [Crocinitomicaceae bacterium]
MPRLILVACFLLIVQACTKDKIHVEPQISYQELNDTEFFTCVDTIVEHPSGCGSVILPSDSIEERLIDLDFDANPDFKISCTSWYNFVSASYPCANYNTSIIISSMDTNAFIATTGMFNDSRKYALSDSIRSTDQWRSSAALLLFVQQAPFTTTFDGLAYFGLKMKKNGEDWFGWVQLEKNTYKIRILSHAVKTGQSTGIKAGEH